MNKLNDILNDCERLILLIRTDQKGGRQEYLDDLAENIEEIRRLTSE